MAEQLILGLRTSDGVPREWLAARLEGDRRLAERVASWRAAGWLIDERDRVRLTEAGFLVSDALFVDLL